MVAMQAVKIISVHATGIPVPGATSPITEFCFQVILLNLHFSAWIMEHIHNTQGLSAEQQL